MLLNGLVFSQTSVLTEVRRDTFLIDLANRYELSAISILPNSEIVILRGKILDASDYTIHANNMNLVLSDSLPYSLFDTVFVTYKTIKLDLKKNNFLQQLLLIPDHQKRDSLFKVINSSTNLNSESIFGKNMQKSGSIVRGFSVSTNKDMTLQSGFRLQLAGKLSEDIDLVAALTDEKTPIQPEGNTERLDELDKVFIQAKHKNAEVTFGDYELKNNNGEFGVLNRKLQGLMTEVKYEKSKGFVAYATEKGKFNSNNITSIDGMQGPYQLFSATNNKDIIIIAGSERVYLNGLLLKRGEQNDYSIDYANAQITFTPNKLIAKESRIIVEFEYSDRLYSRNFFGAGASSRFFKNKLSVGLDYYREGDNQDAPIDITLSSADKKTLALAGNDRNKAVKSGAVVAAMDSLGRYLGVYDKVDTLINGHDTSYYFYNPDTVTAKIKYNVTYTYMGNGLGAYERLAPGVFKYVGDGLGNYNPQIYLPLPELRQFYNIQIGYTDSTLFSFKVSAAASSVDKNRMSGIGDENNIGSAYNISVESSLFSLAGLDSSYGNMKLSARQRYKQKDFSPLERIGDVEFSRQYNLGQVSEQSTERLREVGLSYLKGNSFNTRVDYGSIFSAGLIKSDRIKNNLNFTLFDALKYEHDVDNVKSSISGFESNWLRYNGRTNIELGLIRPLVTYSYENKKETRGNRDSLIISSLSFYEVAPGLNFSFGSSSKMFLSYLVRKDDSPEKGILVNESYSKGISFDADVRSTSAFQSTLKISQRRKNYSQEFAGKGFVDTDILLIKSQIRYSPFRQISSDLYYEASSQRSAQLQRVFVQVPKGTGNYRYIGDLNYNGIKDETEYEPTVYDGEYIMLTVPSDKLYPIIDLKASARLKWNLQKLINDKGLLNDFTEALTFESYGRIDENTKETGINDIYLLRLSKFLKEETTLKGSQTLQQIIHLFENSNEFSIRLQYDQNKNLNSYGSGTEKGFKKSQSLRLKMRLIPEIANQTDISFEKDNMDAPAYKIRNRMLDKFTALSDFSYRPYNYIESGFVLGISSIQDNYPTKPTIVNSNSQVFRINYSFGTSGRLRFEIERNEVLANANGNYIPFEMTNGNAVGKNFYLRMNFDYRIAANLQTTANYDGRKQGESPVIHSARAEVRAFF